MMKRNSDAEESTGLFPITLKILSRLTISPAWEKGGEPNFMNIAISVRMLSFILIFSAQPYCQQPIFASGQVQEDTRIRTMAYPLGQGALNLPSSYVQPLITSAPFATDGFVGVATTIHGDDRAEAFNAHRLSGYHGNFQGPQKGTGTWVDYFRFGSNYPFMIMVDNQYRYNFFTGSFPRAVTRRFSSTTVNRGYSKVDYICPSTCGASNVSTYYRKIGGWDMQAKAWNAFDPPSPLRAYHIVNMDATIHSDGGAPGYIVDNISHIAQNVFSGFTNPSTLLKGGNIWFGYGCTTGLCDSGPFPALIKLYAGPTDNLGNRNYSSYRGGRYKWQSSDPEDNSIPYRDLSKNRGWVKIEFINSINIPQPSYAIKSKAVAIGAWNMRDEHQLPVPIPLSKIGITADRIVGMNTTIQSDYTTSSVSAPGWQITDFNMHNTETPPSLAGEFGSSGGGITFVRNSEIRLLSSKRLSPSLGWANYYSSRHSQKTLNGSTYNRGWVKVDYLAGSCEQGPSNFKIQAIPGVQFGNCAGTAQSFNIEGAGTGFLTNSSGVSDSMTFVYKSFSASNATITVRLESQDANTYGLGAAGITFRNSLSPSSRHVSVVAPKNRNQRVQNWRRRTDGTSNDEPTNSINIPGTSVWLRIVKQGSIFYGHLNRSSSPTLPSSGWEFIGSQTISYSPSYFAGLIVSNSTSARLSKATFSNLTVTSP